jgi:hypothetical protein
VILDRPYSHPPPVAAPWYRPAWATPAATAGAMLSPARPGRRDWKRDMDGARGPQTPPSTRGERRDGISRQSRS